MNGHSTAETLGFCMADVARRWPAIGDVEDTPTFVFTAICGSAERGLLRRLVPTMADESVHEPALIGALASQLARAHRILTGAGASTVSPDAGEQEKKLSRLVRSQAEFLRSTCRSLFGDDRGLPWGMSAAGLSGDFALYFRVLFPRAKFVFLHRNPLEAFADALNDLDPAAVAARDRNWVESFADTWCRLVATYQLWQPEVGGVLIDCATANQSEVAKLEAYLGKRLSPNASNDRSSSCDVELHADEAHLLAERTGEIAARLGHSLAMSVPRASQAPASSASIAAAPAVHMGATRISCAVLVPAIRYIEPECNEALWELERRGYAVIRVRGCSPIDHARSRLATTALEQGFEETMWIDADTDFNPDSVERLRSHALPIIAGLYPRRTPRGGLAAAPMPATPDLVMGEGGSVVEVLYAGTGFLFVRNEVYAAIQQRFNLPLCDKEKPTRAVPFFMPMLEYWGGEMSYLAEDYAFSRRARLCGFKIMADTSIRLWHIGMYRYGYEDAGNAVERVATYRHAFESQKSGK